MKQYIFFILFFVCLCITADTFAQAKVYTGKINNKYEIEMHLLNMKDAAYGYYFYKNKHIPIPLYLNGKKKQEKLIEGDILGDVYFEIVTSDKNITGRWIDKNNKRNYPFSVTEVNTDSLDKGKEKLSGFFKIKGETFQKELTLIFINNTYIYFDISIGSIECMGNICGIAKIQNENKGIFSDEACKQLSFTIKAKAVDITENSCDNYHGIACTFGGIYQLDK